MGEMVLPKDNDDTYEWFVNVNDEVFEQFDKSIDEFFSIRARRKLQNQWLTSMSSNWWSRWSKERGDNVVME
ncbi:hypothetical protein Ancab_038601, partial [Ancistrocladus abbreviatus]